MKKTILITTALVMALTGLKAQNLQKLKAEEFISKKKELTFTFQVQNKEELNNLANNLSIVNYDPTTQTVKAWANESQFRMFETLNIPYQVPTSENKVQESDIYDMRPLAFRSSSATLSFPLGSYPTYSEYAQQMQDFENNYPNLVDKFSIGATTQGDKELLFVKISDNVNTDEQEPKLLLTSSMHGDEVAGYPMMLTLIDYILTVYSNTGHPDHMRVKNLVENAEIWINPSANPDGTYHNSANNTSVAGSRRGNANNIDLNRNYPDNVAGAHYDGNSYQTETLHFIQLAQDNHFVISANFHGGTELVNYPFDNAYTNQYEHPDGNWFEYIGVEYASNAQTDAISGNSSSPSYDNKSSYMRDDEDSNVFPSQGVTHGAEWYRVFGGRQDYMNFYHQCKEITIELSDTKILPESQLVNYWYYNRDALLDFLTQGTYGFRGVVKNINTDEPIEGATVTLIGHDNYGSHTFTDTGFGDYYRPVKAGSYNILFEAPCYQPVTLYNQSISDYQTKILADVQLTPQAVSAPTDLTASNESSTSADVSWTSEGEMFTIRYREVGTTTWSQITEVTENPYTLTELNLNTNYEFKVKAFCSGNGSSFSSKGYFSTTDLTYCNAQANNSNYFYINNVQVNTINSSSGGNGYSDFTSQSTTLSKDTQYSLSISTTYTSSQYNLGYSAWIDFNRDGDFDDENEQIYSRSTTQNTLNTTNFTVPENVARGNARLRVVMRYDYSHPPACESFQYGEIEDYTINLFNGLLYSNNTWTPSAPSNLTASENIMVLDGTYNTSSPLNVNDIVVGSGATLNINKEHAVTVNGDITNNGEFILNSDSNEFSSLLLNGTANGELKYKRHVNSNSNRNDLIAAPFSGESFTDFLSNNSNIVANQDETLYLFGPFDKTSSEYITYSPTETTTLQAGKGYRAASTDNNTFTFSGAPTTGTLNVPIEKTGTAYQMWNLIGNPYPSYIRLEDFLLANLNEFDTETVAVYGYDTDNSNGSYWTILNLANTDSNTLIAPGQGFYVSSKDGGGNVTFTPSMKTSGSSDDFIAGRESEATEHTTITLSSSTKTFHTDIYFTNNATLGLDIGYDAGHFDGAPSEFSIYSELVQNNTGKDMAIQAIGFSDINDTTIIPLGVNSSQGEQLTIGINNTNTNFDIYLEDALTNTFTLLKTSDYTFTPNSDLSDTGRFYLRFEATALSDNDSNLETLQVYAMNNEKKVIIKGLLQSETLAVMYDMQGREITRKKLDSNTNVNYLTIENYSDGLYIIHLSNKTYNISRKILVR